MVEYRKQNNSPFTTQFCSSPRSRENSFDYGSVAAFNFNVHALEKEDLSQGFFGSDKDAKNHLISQHWNDVALYTIIFFSFILNIYLILKLLKRRQNLTIT